MKRHIKSFTTKVLPIILTLGTVTTLTVLSMLYARGYRVSFDEVSINTKPTITVTKTGIIAVRSIPDAAKIYINDELKDTTNATIASIPTGKYKLRVQKEGYESWEKEIEVYEELVTDITAVLVLRGGGLNPLTNTGVGTYQISNSGEVLVFTSKQEDKPGIYQLTLSSTPINIFQSGKKAVILDKPRFEYSKAKEISFGPEDQEILLKMDEGIYYLIDLNGGTSQTPVSLVDPDVVFKKWLAIDTKNKKSSVETLEVPIELTELAYSNSAIWSPDGEKFMVAKKPEGEKNNYFVEVYNFEDPIQIGEERFYKNVEFTGDDTNIYWYSDSKHLLVVTKDGIEMINMDGTNRFRLFTGQVIGSKAVATPGGDKVVFLTKIKEDAPTNLYMVSIR